MLHSGWTSKTACERPAPPVGRGRFRSLYDRAFTSYYDRTFTIGRLRSVGPSVAIAPRWRRSSFNASDISASPVVMVVAAEVIAATAPASSRSVAERLLLWSLRHDKLHRWLCSLPATFTDAGGVEVRTAWRGLKPISEFHIDQFWQLGMAVGARRQLLCVASTGSKTVASIKL